jgi:hypothetical protein
MPMQQQQMLAPGTQDGNWVWNGSEWVCGSCDGSGGSFPGCLPPGFPPPGCPPWFSGMNSPPWYPGANAGVSFGTTAPLNPVRGHFWWDGVTLWLFDGAAFVAVGGTGTVPGTAPGTVSATQQVFSLQQPTTLAVAPATWVATPFTSTPNINSMGTWDATTFKWTPNKAGVYEVFCLGNYSLPAGGTEQQQVVKNDSGTLSGGAPSDIVCIGAVNSAAAGSGYIQSSGIVTMNGTTDFLRHWSWVSVSPVQLMWTIPTWKIFKLP